MIRMDRLHPDTEGRPLYLRIADAINRAILSGEYPPGAKLPSRNHVADRLNVAPMTVTGAYTELARLGIVETLKGSGTFVTREALMVLRGYDVAAFRAETAALKAQVAALTERVDQLARELEQQRQHPDWVPSVPEQTRR